MDPLLKKAATLGLGLLDLTEEKARELVDEIVRRGEARREEADDLATSLLDHARGVREFVRKTVARQITAALEETDLAALEKRIAALEARLGPEQQD